MEKIVEKFNTFSSENIINESVTDKTFDEIDEKLSILNEETISWIKGKIMFHISEAYNRGKNSEHLPED
jgi:hypothetical protein